MAIFLETQAQNSDTAHWVGTWAAAPVGMDNSKGTIGTADFTIRQIVHTSLAGNVVRVVFTNEMGTTPLTLAGAQAALVLLCYKVGTSRLIGVAEDIVA